MSSIFFKSSYLAIFKQNSIHFSIFNKSLTEMKASSLSNNTSIKFLHSCIGVSNKKLIEFGYFPNKNNISKKK